MEGGMTPNRNKTLVGIPLPHQLEEAPFPLTRRISYTRLTQMLPPPADIEIVPPARETMRSWEASQRTPWIRTLLFLALGITVVVTLLGGGW
jgi:hypothetical protein